MKVTTRRLISIGAVAAVAAFGLTACASDEAEAPESSTTALTIWVDAERAEALQGAADGYEEATGIEVKLVSKDNATIKDDFLQQAESGAVDIVLGAHDWLGELVKNGVVAPVELGDKSADFLPVALQAATYEGSTYLLPYAVENIAILRNADLVPEAASSYDDMIAKGTAAGVDYAFVVEQGPDGNPYHLYPFQTGFGAPVFGTNADGTYNPEDLQLGSAGGYAFADWLGAEGKNGTGVLNTEITGDIAKTAFTEGKAAFWLTGPWNVGAALDAGINVAVDPNVSPGPDTANPFAGVKGFLLNQFSENKVAATDFLVNYVATEEVQTSLFEAGNILPVLSASAEAASSDPIIAGFAAAGENAVPMPAIPAMGGVWQFWGIAEAAIINGADPKTTWDKLVADVQGSLG